MLMEEQIAKFKQALPDVSPEILEEALDCLRVCEAGGLPSVYMAEFDYSHVKDPKLRQLMRAFYDFVMWTDEHLRDSDDKRTGMRYLLAHRNKCIDSL